ncbi:MAG: hypothetical protein AB7P17_09060 [Nitrospirales bacterium]|nr:hypothetical protein [Nitrospirales bacterium]
MKEVRPFTRTMGRTGGLIGMMITVPVMGFLVACVPPKVQTQQAPQFAPSAINSVALVPFRILETPQWGSNPLRGGIRDPEEIRTQFRLPGTDQIDVTEGRKNLYVVPEVGAQRLTNMVMSALAGRPSLRVVGPPETAVTIKTEGSQISPSFSSMAKDVGTRFSVDAVLLGLVRTYRERDGSKLGATPAAVGFELYLVRSDDGVVLWKGEYYEEQKPMTEDIVGFWEKGGFVTVDELASFGVNKVMNAFPVGK